MDSTQLAEHLRARLSAPCDEPPRLLRARVTGIDAVNDSWIVAVEDYANAVPDPALDPGPGPDPDTKPSPVLDPVLEAIREAGVPEELCAHLADAVHACALVGGGVGASNDEYAAGPVAGVQSEAQGLLAAVETLASTSCRLDAVLVSAARQLTGANGRLLLADKGASSPEELSTTQRDRWRARSKSVTRGEIGAAIGWGVGEVSDLVALANAPAAVRVPVQSSLAAAESSWKLARTFWRRAGSLPHEDGAAIANGLFGPDPAHAVTERLDSAGRFTGQPWPHKQFHQAVDREVARMRTKDPDATRQTRARELAQADVWVTVDRDGVGGVGIKCSNTRAAAIGERIDHAARRARAAGDPRTLRQLRTAIVTALLLHGTVPETLRSGGGSLDESSDKESREGTSPKDLAPQPSGEADDASPIGHPGCSPACSHPGSCDPVSVLHSPQLDRVLSDLPSATINVVVPLGALVPGRFAGSGHAGPDGIVGADAQRPDYPGDDSLHCGTCVCGATRADATSRTPDGDRPQEHPVSVAEVTGRWRHFISPTEARGLALAPGSTLYRLLTDPASGRCLERSTASYRFDAAMRTQIAFADGTCRAPNCTVPASQCQFDHVQEYGTPGGETSEANGALAHGIDHQRKTEKLWDAVIDTNRDMTWTSMLGRIYRTKAHDYGQYTKLLAAATVDIEQIPCGEDRDAAIDSAIYAALSYRPQGDRLESEDDSWEGEDYAAWDLVSLTHTNAAGRRRYEADPAVVRAERQRVEEVHGTGDRDTDAPVGSGKETDDRDADTRAASGSANEGDPSPRRDDEYDGPPPF